MKVKTRLLAALLCVLMVAAVCPIVALPAFAQATGGSGNESKGGANAVEPDIWDGTVASAFAGGSGTEADPYLIANGEQLARVAEQVNSGADNFSGKYLKLTADIWLNDVRDKDWKTKSPNQWTPIGDETGKAFSGTLDGDGYAVYGTYISGTFKLQINERYFDLLAAGDKAGCDWMYYVKTGENTVDVYYGLGRNFYTLHAVGFIGRSEGCTVRNLAMGQGYFDVTFAERKNGIDVVTADGLSTKYTGLNLNGAAVANLVGTVTVDGTDYTVQNTYLCAGAKNVTVGDAYFLVKGGRDASMISGTTWQTAEEGKLSSGDVSGWGNVKSGSFSALIAGTGDSKGAVLERVFVNATAQCHGEQPDSGMLAGYFNPSGRITDCATTGSTNLLGGLLSGHGGGTKVENCYTTVGRAVNWTSGNGVSKNNDKVVTGHSGYVGLYTTDLTALDSGVKTAFANDAPCAVINLVDTRGNARTQMPALFYTYAPTANEDGTYTAAWGAERGVWAEMDGYTPIQQVFVEKHSAAELYRILGVQTVYEIGTAAELWDYATKVNSGAIATEDTAVVLTADIDLTADGFQYWEPIGNTSDVAFRGTFDGAGHSISHMYIYKTGHTAANGYGLIGWSQGNNAVKNLALLEGFLVSGKATFPGSEQQIQSASFIGKQNGTTFLKNLYSEISAYTGGFSGGKGVSKNCFAGLTAYMNGGSLYATNCVYAGTVLGGEAALLFGGSNLKKIENCYATARHYSDTTMSSLAAWQAAYYKSATLYLDTSNVPVTSLSGNDNNLTAQLANLTVTTEGVAPVTFANAGEWVYKAGYRPIQKVFYDAHTANDGWKAFGNAGRIGSTQGGEGTYGRTATNPFCISSRADLIFYNLTNAAHWITYASLEADVSLADHLDSETWYETAYKWTPCQAGILFNGNGHAIRGMYLYSKVEGYWASTASVGMFTGTWNPADTTEIQDLAIIQSRADVVRHSANLNAATSLATKDADGNITFGTTDGKPTMATGNQTYFGTFVARASGTIKLSGCYTDMDAHFDVWQFGNDNGTAVRGGGLIGAPNAFEIKDSAFAGNIQVVSEKEKPYTLTFDLQDKDGTVIQTGYTYTFYSDGQTQQIGGIWAFDWGSNTTMHKVTNTYCTPGVMSGTTWQSVLGCGSNGYWNISNLYTSVAISGLTDAKKYVNDAGELTNTVTTIQANGEQIAAKFVELGFVSCGANTLPIPATIAAGRTDLSDFAKSYVAEAAISTPAQLMNPASVLPTYARGVKASTVYLDRDIDLAGVTWSVNSLSGITIDGRGHKISNLTVSGKAQVGLYNTVSNVAFKNLILDNFNVTCLSSTAYVCALFCSAAGTVDVTNVYVNANLRGYKQVAAFGGWNGGTLNLTNVLVTGVINATGTSDNHSGVLVSGGGTTICKNVLSLAMLRNDNCDGWFRGSGKLDTSSSGVYGLNWGTLQNDTKLGFSEGLTPDQLLGAAAKTTLKEFDFENVWTTTSGYPTLKIAVGKVTDPTPTTKAGLDASLKDSILGGSTATKNLASDLTLLGAQLRMRTDGTTTKFDAMRFGSSVKLNTSSALYQILFGTGNYEYNTAVKFGTLVIPSSKLAEGAELTVDTASVLNIPAQKILSQEEGVVVFTGVLTGIPDTEIATDLTARSYIAYSTDGGSTYTYVYSDAITRSVEEVAVAAYPSQTAEMQALLKAAFPDVDFEKKN